jgi:DNA-directed RNA polymerase subunit H
MSPTRARSRKSKKAAAAGPAPVKRPFTAHHLVPPHEVLSEAEGAAALAALRTLPERLPKILLNDPGLQTDLKFLAMRDAGEPLVGRLVRVRRPSQTAGEAVAYRLLVAALGE